MPKLQLKFHALKLTKLIQVVMSQQQERKKLLLSLQLKLYQLKLYPLKKLKLKKLNPLMMPLLPMLKPIFKSHALKLLKETLAVTMLQLKNQQWPQRKL